MKRSLAPVYSSIVKENLGRLYPYHFAQLAEGDEPMRTPAELYPAFHTSYDWHSCVHMHWLGVELLRSGLADPDLRTRLDGNLRPDAVAAEAQYVRSHSLFERPYGWAWAARLGASSAGFAADGDADAARWAQSLAPLLDAVYVHATAWSTRIDHPVRHGVHSNTAFGLALLLDAARALGRDADVAVLEESAIRLFAGDVGWVGRWELSGQDFLSPGLTEADLLSRVLPAPQFAEWFAAFLPSPLEVASAAVVSDRTDAQMVHLDGLNLSRAGALYRIARALESAGQEAPSLRSAADALLAHGLESTRSEEYVSTHWLASFAWDALLSRD